MEQPLEERGPQPAERRVELELLAEARGGTTGGTTTGGTTGGGMKTVSFTRTDYAVGRAPSVVAIGDFNGDGIADIATVRSADAGSSDITLAVLLGNGDGTFRTPATMSLPLSIPESIVAADFNHDGKLDLVIGETGGLTVLLGNGDGSFHPLAFQRLGQDATRVAVGDFNHDGIPDIAAVDDECCGLYVLLGNGDGTFQVQSPNQNVGNAPTSIVSADFNGDGIPDLVVAHNPSSGGTLSILLGKGDGTFQSARDFGPQTRAVSGSSIASADFNKDGLLDLVAAGNSIMLGKGDGTFQAPLEAPDPGSAFVVVGDFNGDGIADLATVQSSANQTNQISVMLGNGDGTFGSPIAFQVGVRPVYMAAGDLNKDGRIDLVVANFDSGTISVLTSAASSSATAKTVVYVANQGSSTVSGFQLNTDGSLTSISGSPWPAANALALASVGNTLAVGATKPTSTTSAAPSPTISFKIESGTGALTHVGDIPMTDQVNDAIADGSNIYLATSNGIYAFSGTDGTLTLVPGSPFFSNTPGQDPRANKTVERLGADPLASYLFAGFTGASSNSGFFVAPPRNSDGSLGAFSPNNSTLADHTYGIVLTSNRKFIFRIDDGNLHEETFDPATGQHTQISGNAASNLGDLFFGDLALSPSGTYLYVLSHPLGASQAGQVHVLKVDQNSGTLQEISGSPFNTGGTGPSRIAVDPSGRYLLVTHGNANSTTPSNDLSVLAADATTGALTLVGSPHPMGTNPNEMAIVILK